MLLCFEYTICDTWLLFSILLFLVYKILLYFGADVTASNEKIQVYNIFIHVHFVIYFCLLSLLTKCIQLVIASTGCVYTAEKIRCLTQIGM